MNFPNNTYHPSESAMTSYNIIQGLFCLKIFEMIMVNRIVKQNFHNTSLRTSWLDNTKMFEIVKNQNFAAWWWLVQSFSLPTVSSFHSVTMVGKKKKELLAASDNKDNSFVPTTIFFFSTLLWNILQTIVDPLGLSPLMLHLSSVVCVTRRSGSAVSYSLIYL